MPYPQRSARLTRDEALRLLARGRAERTADGRWSCPVGPLTLRFPDFAWRRRALHPHDLHHLMTGYPMTMCGEFQLAAWEWGAGRYPDWRATWFCAPLILAGLFWSPSRIFAAYRAGRRTRSLYSALGSECR